MPTAPLADVVGGFLDEWNRDRPQVAGRFVSADYDGVDPVRAAAWLSENSGVAETTISRIVGRRTNMTELRIADALVQALERPDLFYDGDPPTLPIYQNPAAPIRERLSCCGGSALVESFTGSASR